MPQTVQQHFVQVTIQKGRVMQNDDGSTEKVVDEIAMDNLFCHPDEVFADVFIQQIQQLTPQLE